MPFHKISIKHYTVWFIAWAHSQTQSETWSQRQRRGRERLVKVTWENLRDKTKLFRLGWRSINLALRGKFTKGFSLSAPAFAYQLITQSLALSASRICAFVSVCLLYFDTWITAMSLKTRAICTRLQKLMCVWLCTSEQQQKHAEASQIGGSKGHFYTNMAVVLFFCSVYSVW